MASVYPSVLSRKERTTQQWLILNTRERESHVSKLLKFFFVFSPPQFCDVAKVVIIYIRIDFFGKPLLCVLKNCPDYIRQIYLMPVSNNHPTLVINFPIMHLKKRFIEVFF
jgi:hypothetical protein